MSARRVPRTRSVALLGLVCACAAPPAEDVRGPVREDVERRLDQPVSWDENAGSDAVAAALEDGLLGADEAVRVAVANNPGLQVTLAELDVSRAMIAQAALLPNPVVDAELQFVEAGGGDLLELGVAQGILGTLTLPWRRRVAARRHESVEAEVAAAVLDLVAETRTTYRRLQAQRELVELYVLAAEASGLAFDAARRLREAGNVRELEVLTEQALHGEARVALAAARANVRSLREELNVLLGVWGPEGERWTVEPRLPLPAPVDVTADELEARVVRASLDLRAQHRRILAVGQELGLERLEAKFPEAMLGVVAERESDETWSAGPKASVSVPLFDRGQAVDAAGRARLDRAGARYADLAVRVRRAARSAWVRSVTSGENGRYLREVVVPLRVRITEQTQLQFNAMQLGVFQLLAAKRDELAAARRSVEALREHWVERIRLETLLMGRLPRARFGLAGGGVGSPASTPDGGDAGGH